MDTYTHIEDIHHTQTQTTDPPTEIRGLMEIFPFLSFLEKKEYGFGVC